VVASGVCVAGSSGGAWFTCWITMGGPATDGGGRRPRALLDPLGRLSRGDADGGPGKGREGGGRWGGGGERPQWRAPGVGASPRDWNPQCLSALEPRCSWAVTSPGGLTGGRRSGIGMARRCPRWSCALSLVFAIIQAVLCRRTASWMHGSLFGWPQQLHDARELDVPTSRRRRSIRRVARFESGVEVPVPPVCTALDDPLAPRQALTRETPHQRRPAAVSHTPALPLAPSPIHPPTRKTAS